nr:hypothetical protein [Nanoarchaeum sp.]
MKSNNKKLCNLPKLNVDETGTSRVAAKRILKLRDLKSVLEELDRAQILYERSSKRYLSLILTLGIGRDEFRYSNILSLLPYRETKIVSRDALFYVQFPYSFVNPQENTVQSLPLEAIHDYQSLESKSQHL